MGSDTTGSAAALAELGPATRHRVVAARFTDLLNGVVDWAVPAPVDGWTARDVVGHLVEWFPTFVAAGSDHSWPAGPPVSEDPVGAWAAQVEGVQALLDDPATAAATFTHPHLPELSFADTVDRFYTADVFMHSWDLARASGQDAALDADFAQQLLDGMRAMEEVIRGSGQFGEAQPVADDAPADDRLMAFIGRDPGR